MLDTLTRLAIIAAAAGYLWQLKGKDKKAMHKPAITPIVSGPGAEPWGYKDLLVKLQAKAQLLDCLMEDVSGLKDDEIARAFRDVQARCQRVLSAAGLLPIIDGIDEEVEVNVPEGFDASAIRLEGKPRGDGPWRGVLKHAGWQVGGVTLAYAVVEVK